MNGWLALFIGTVVVLVVAGVVFSDGPRVRRALDDVLAPLDPTPDLPDADPYPNAQHHAGDPDDCATCKLRGLA